MIRRKHFLYFLTSLGHCLYFLCVFCSFFSFHKTSQVIELKNMAVYFPGFKDYRDGSDYDQIAYDWVSAHKDELQGKRILSVGCGQGQIDLHIIKEVSPTTYVGVDPSINMFSVFQQKVENLKKEGELNGVDIQLFNQQFEEYVIPKEKFDFVFMFHCMYYMTSYKDAVTKALKLADKLIFIMASPSSEFIDFAESITNERALPTTQDVIDACKDSGFNFRQIGTIPTTIKLEKEMSEPYLEFFLHRKPTEQEIEKTKEVLNTHSGTVVEYAYAYSVTKAH